MRTLLFLLLLFALPATAQTILQGQITDRAGKPLKGVSVYLENTLDGTTSDSLGQFKLETGEKGAQTLVASATGFEAGGQPVQLDSVSAGSVFVIRLKVDANSLGEVVITAGAFEAANSNNTVLKPLDILTTAGANADVVRAIQTLPGTQQQGNQTGLFVRGGDASEAAVVVDGLTVQNAFFSAAPGVAARSRFLPFQFKGVAFSSGGYSARYGQALSSVLELNSLDMPDKSTVNLGANMAGVYASGSKLWDTTISIEGAASYTNLQPFYKFANTNFDFYDVPRGGGGSGKIAWRPRAGGLLKVLANYATFSSGTQVPDPDAPGQPLRFGISNQNGYGIVSYRQLLGSKWNLYAAGLLALNKDVISQNGTPAGGDDSRVQARLEATRYFTSRVSLLFGLEGNDIKYNRNYNGFETGFKEQLAGGYTELSWSPKYWLSLRPGLRYEYSTLFQKSMVSPRMSAALRAGKNGTFSLAGGLFYQDADPGILVFGFLPQPARATHAIVNYQWAANNRILRLEAYYKKYQSLAQESSTGYDPNPFHYPVGPVLATGDGYAQGAELFWRDQKTVRNFDYWVSYSFIDTRRQYRNYPTSAQPTFIATNTLNIVSKYWINKLEMQINATYSYASGRPYFNPANPAFLADRTPDFHNLALTVNKLFSIRRKWFTVVFVGIDNALDRKNIFGYSYRSATDANPRPQYPALFRSFFIGFNMSRTEFKRDEL